MKIRLHRFNTYLLASALLFGLGGCTSSGSKDAKELAALRLHLEVNPDGTENNSAVLVGRSTPFLVNLNKEPFLTEYKITSASLVDSYGGFSLSVKFDTEGSWIIEQYTTANKGKRVGVSAIFGQAQEPRWLGAPRIIQRITNGVFVFTPDASRKEADRLVAGLNNFADKVKKGRK
jgi:preprotein translocase subunit SecD